MSEILYLYERPDPTTWVYLSSFLTIGLYFVFHRFWSIRNLDIVLVILLAPGLLMVHEGHRRKLRERQAAVLAAQREADDSPQKDSSQLASSQTPDELPSGEEIPAEGPPEGQAADSGSRADATDPAPADPAPADSDPADSPPADSGSGDPPASVAAAPGSTAAGPPTDSAFSHRVLQRNGFIWLFVIELLILVRLLFDSAMVRRPLLDPNLTTGGLNFIGISLFIFMMANVVTSTPRIQQEQGPELGPGYALMNMLPAIPTRPVSESVAGAEPPAVAELTPAQQRVATIAKVLAIAAQAAIVTGIVLIGNRHFGNLRAGTGGALLYLLLPYTAQMTGRVDHAVPAALLLWAVLNYRRPMVAGIFLGLAGGLVYYPLFLLPLWFSFYWLRGARRFGVGVVATLAFLVLLLSVDGAEALFDHFRRMFGLFKPTMEPRGIWAVGWSPVWRLPVIVAFVILSAVLAVWPAQKNLGTLISCSAAVMVAAQFWHGYGGGLYIGWFLPLLLLTIFRPNLQDRVALKVIDGARMPQGRPMQSEVEAA